MSDPVNAVVAPAVVRTRALRKAYGELVAVAGLDLEIARGEVFGLLGPNGSGKTTTIRMLCGLVVPTSGTAEVAGLDPVKGRDLERGGPGFEEGIGGHGGLRGLSLPAS